MLYVTLTRLTYGKKSLVKLRLSSTTDTPDAPAVTVSGRKPNTNKFCCANNAVIGCARTQRPI